MSVDTLSKLYGQMDQKYGKNVYLTRIFWMYNLIFVRNHTMQVDVITP